MISKYSLHLKDINYNEKAQRVEIYYGNCSKIKYEYDAKSFRLTRLLTTRNSGRDILQDIHYIYDAAGNIVEQEDKAHQKHFFKNLVVEPKVLYYYDALYRLVKAKGRELKNLGMPSASDIPDSIGLPNIASDAMQNYTHEYKYDELGNILQHKSLGQWTRDYLYDFTRNNHLLGHTAGKTEYAYDAHGNMLKIPHLNSMNWDCSRNLSSVDLDEAGNKAFYVYDASGERVRKIIEKGNIREQRYYFGEYENYAKFVSDSQVCERISLHISDDKSKIASIDKQTIKDGKAVEEPTVITRYQLDNHLGSACLELDEKAEIISYEEYYPFGTSSYRSARSETEVSQKRYKYCGKERDDESGLHYYGARYYAAWLGRFISVDPLKEERSWMNPYNYCQNNPVNRIDPDGALDDDYKLNKKTGDITLVKETNDKKDRILKTNNKGALKIKGDGLFGFLVCDSEKGKFKVIIGNIQKGILKERMNFKTNNNIINVGGEGQATVDGFESFIVKFSDYVGREIAGAYFSKNEEKKTSAITTGMYKNNTSTSASGHGHNLRRYFETVQEIKEYSLIGFFHTHPSSAAASDRLVPSDKDLESRNNALRFNPSLEFKILTTPEYDGEQFPKRVNYTKGNSFR